MDRRLQILEAGKAAAAGKAWPEPPGWSVTLTPVFEEWGLGSTDDARVVAVEAVKRASEQANVAPMASYRRSVARQRGTQVTSAEKEAALERSQLRKELGDLRARVEKLEHRDAERTEPGSGIKRSPSWRETHAHELMAHAGRYVAWGAQGIVASAESYSALLVELDKRGNPRGLGIEYVPKGPRIRR